MYLKTFIFFISLISFVDAAENTVFLQTGRVNGTVLGAVESPIVLDQKWSSLIDYDVDLESWKFDCYIPAHYDGSKSFGIVSFISSHSKRSEMRKELIPVCDELDLIFIGGQSIGNDQDENVRRGVCLMGLLRATELFSVDSKRMYVAGTSGGGRASMSLAFLHPELICGSVGRVGGAFPLDIATELRSGDGYGRGKKRTDYKEYEYALFSTLDEKTRKDIIRNALAFDRRWSLLTFYDDFREGCLQNIYHFGFEPFGFQSKLVEEKGAHTTHSVTSFKTAFDFLEHPMNPVVAEDFDSGVPEYISPHSFDWYDRHGAVLKFKVKLCPDNGNWNQKVTIKMIGQGSEDAGLYLTIDQKVDKATAQFTIQESDGSETVLFTGTFGNPFEDDENVHVWNKSERELDIRISLWEDGLQVNFGCHFETTTGATLLGDKRTFHLRWPEEFKQSASIYYKSYLTVSSEPSDPGGKAGKVFLKAISIKDSSL